jgi:GT2 family glycosyltransferase
MKRKTVAVIVTYNRLDALKTTVGNTLAQDFHAVVVVNNLSTDGTKEWLDEQTDPRLQLIHSEANLGGAGGFHLGFEHAAFNIPDAEWLVAFDDDAYPEPGTLDAFDRMDIPEDVGGLAAAVYLPDGSISEMNRPSVNPFWHLKELVTTSFRGREGFHVDDKDYSLTSHREIDASSFVGFFLRLSLIREGKIGLPRSELFVYYDDIIYVLLMRKAGFRHWFVPALRFSHDCQTLTEKSDVFEPLWRAYFMFRNRLEMYRIASGLFCPAVLGIKIPKFFLAARHYKRSDRKRFLAITAKAVRHGLSRDFTWSFADVLEFSRNTNST